MTITLQTLHKNLCKRAADIEYTRSFRPSGDKWYGNFFNDKPNKQGLIADTSDYSPTPFNVLDAIGAAAGAAGSVYGLRKIPQLVLDPMLKSPDKAKAYGNFFNKEILGRTPFVAKLPAKFRMPAAMLAAGAGAAGLSGLAGGKEDISQFIDDITNQNKDKSLLSDVAYTSGGTALGTLLGYILSGNSDSNLLPILGGIVGGAGGYALNNKDKIAKLFS